MTLSSWRATAPVLAAAVALLVAGAAAQPPDCALDCPGINSVEDSTVCSFLDSVKDDQCIADCAASVVDDIANNYACCMTDCQGYDTLFDDDADVCAFLESVKDHQCVTDCADGVLEGIAEDAECNGNSAASLASHVVLVSLAAAVALLA